MASQGKVELVQAKPTLTGVPTPDLVVPQQAHIPPEGPS